MERPTVPPRSGDTYAQGPHVTCGKNLLGACRCMTLLFCKVTTKKGRQKTEGNCCSSGGGSFRLASALSRSSTKVIPWRPNLDVGRLRDWRLWLSPVRSCFNRWSLCYDCITYKKPGGGKVIDLLFTFIIIRLSCYYWIMHILFLLIRMRSSGRQANYHRVHGWVTGQFVFRVQQF